MSKSEPKTYTWPWLITAWSFPLLVVGAIGVGSVRSMRAGLELEMKQASQTAINQRHNERKEALRKWGESITNLVGYSSGFSPVPTKLSDETVPVPLEDKSKIQKDWEIFVNSTVNPEVGNLQGLRNLFNEYTTQLEGALAAQLSYVQGVASQGGLPSVTPSMSESEVLGAVAKIVSVPPRDMTPEALRDARLNFSGKLSSYTLADAVDMRHSQAVGLNERLGAQYDEAVWHSAWKDMGNNSFKRVDESLSEDLDRVAANTRQYSNDWARDVVSKTEGVKRGYTGTQDQYDTMASNLDGQSTQIVGALGAFERALNESIDSIKKDTDSFRALIGEIKLTGGQSVIAKTMTRDGELTSVNNAARLVHINLGTDKNIKPGMRFEVWRIGGKNADHFKGVIEVVRTVGRHYSLATVLELTDDSNPLLAGDSIINRLWDSKTGAYLNVALHGRDWKEREDGEPGTLYDKYELAELLKNIGCTVQERATPSTDLVILGIGSGDGDDHYKEMSKAVRFEVLRELQIRLYVQPR